MVYFAKDHSRAFRELIYMKYLKALLTLLLCAALLCACAPDENAQTAAAPTAAPVLLGFSQLGSESAWRVGSTRSIEEAAERHGVSLMMLNAYQKQEKQIDAIRSFISYRVDVISFAPIVEDGWDTVLTEAKAAGIPVVFFNRDFDVSVLESYEESAFVGTDPAEAGHMQGKAAGEYLVENFDAVDLNGDGKISYVMFKGQEGNPEAEMRTKYGVEDANAVLAEAGKPALEFYDANNTSKYLVDQTGAWSSQAAVDYMNTILGQYNEGNNNMIELIICNNDGMAEGAVAALNDKGYNTGDPKKTIPVFGVDATDAAKKLIADGKMVGTIKQDAEGMADCIAQLTQNTAEGKGLVDGVDKEMISEKVANKIFIPYGIYTGEDK